MIIKIPFVPFNIKIQKTLKNDIPIPENKIQAELDNQTKIFCIGRNKTGTTSLEKTFKDLGFEVGDQGKAELLLDSYIERNFKPILEYCRTAQIFQDFPFSYPFTYQFLDQAYPNSKFILTVRDSPEQWYSSVTRFHAKLFGNGNIPTSQQLREANYVNKGWIWKSVRELYKTPEDDPYNKNALIAHYNKYNYDVLEYFKNRPDDFIVINLASQGSYNKLMNFLQIKSPQLDFPWENRT